MISNGNSMRKIDDKPAGGKDLRNILRLSILGKQNAGLTVTSGNQELWQEDAKT